MTQNRAAHATIAIDEWRLLAPRRSLATVVVAGSADRTDVAAWAPCETDRRSDVHQRVMPLRRSAFGADLAIELDGLAVGGGAAEHSPTEHAADVRVGEGRRLAERETCDRRCRVRTNPRKGVESRDGAREARRVSPCDPVQISRPTVVAEARPFAEHLAERSAGQGPKGRESLQKTPVREEDTGDLRLLEHHLADEDAVRIAGVSPRKVAPRPPVPREDAPAKRRVGCRPGVQFAEQKSSPVEC